MASKSDVVTSVGMSDNEYTEYILKKTQAVKELYQNNPSGKRKSGKFWKNTRSRFSSLKKDKCMSSTWAEKTKKRLEMKAVKDFEKELKERKAAELKNNKIIAKQKRLRKLENERKAEVVQPIKNLKKLKNMKKKLLRKSNIQIR
ncbi:coiled-coil domain-containing protein 86 [Octopus bimaculoides]|uniref:Coiled-coil domain-containing protein 86 n=1 Tax=Octopus bimaculoides TaxID=37653 RepID=A0A0L8I9Y7_OCTBM|nr:coiled-coil domain-containing protein 86 [Octopus bimaculoides]|eukprot:XP_014782843.1 PREDICTED: coiled-coil domain-containing protein 86-like [Octopus bimaculoides]